MKLVLTRERTTLLSNLYALFEANPNVTLDLGDALAQGLVTESQLVLLYRSLINFLREEFSERIILYLPFELLPGNSWSIESQELKGAIEAFKEIYLLKWRMLLSRHDIRANFVDGDIPEVEMRMGPLPQVVKAAHLIPILIRKGILEEGEDRRIFLQTDDSVLQRSISEAMVHTPAVRKKSPDLDVPNIAWLEKKIEEAHEALGLVRRALEQRLAPKTRIQWEIEDAEGLIIEGVSTEIAEALKSHKSPEGLRLSSYDLCRCILNTDDRLACIIGITAMRKAVEDLYAIDKPLSLKIYSDVIIAVDHLWDLHTNQAEIRDSVESTLSRLSVIGVRNERLLARLGIRTPRFDRHPFPIGQEAQSILEGIVEMIGEDRALSSLIFPVVILGGSRVKGYDKRDSDLDIAIIVRPGVPFSQQSYIQRLISELLYTYGLRNKVLELWTDEKSGLLRVQDIHSRDKKIGNSFMTHVLFGGIWIGSSEALGYFSRTLLSGYLKAEDEQISGQNNRELWLEEIERDALQCRLMQRGYHHFYPERRSVIVPEGIVDSGGAFWDSGYRRVATLLFLKKVFLPRI